MMTHALEYSRMGCSGVGAQVRTVGIRVEIAQSKIHTNADQSVVDLVAKPGPGIRKDAMVRKTVFERNESIALVELIGRPLRSLVFIIFVRAEVVPDPVTFTVKELRCLSFVLHLGCTVPISLLTVSASDLSTTRQRLAKNAAHTRNNHVP
jgi:hypothetical protein